MGGIRIHGRDRDLGFQNPARPSGRVRVPQKDYRRPRLRLSLAIEVPNGLRRQFGGGGAPRSRESNQNECSPRLTDPLSQLVGIIASQEIGGQLRNAVAGQKSLAAHRRNKPPALRGGQIRHQYRPQRGSDLGPGDRGIVAGRHRGRAQRRLRPGPPPITLKRAAGVGYVRQISQDAPSIERAEFPDPQPWPHICDRNRRLGRQFPGRRRHCAQRNVTP